MTLPLTLIVITGEIDLSVASMLGLCERAARVPLESRLADGRRSFAVVLARRRRRRRFQRLAGHPRRAPVARGHDRHADALPRDRV